MDVSANNKAGVVVVRITDSALVNNIRKNLQGNMQNLNDVNEKVSTGKKFQRASEDPIGASQSLKYASLISGGEQHEDNVDAARRWLNTTEDSLADSGKIVQRARELAVHGANGSLTETERENLASEVGELKEELASIANSKLGDEYIFSGQATDKAAYNKADVASGVIDYQGDSYDIKREITPGIEMPVNVKGNEVFSGALEALNELEARLGDPARVNEISEQSVEEIDEELNNISNTRAGVGAKMNRLDMVENRLESELINLKEMRSKNEEIDLAETITDLKMEESVYRASLSAGARSMQPSLVDFLD
ncbi:MAG: flagellar hook-associated protein FlgL [Bacillota bacterium]